MNSPAANKPTTRIGDERSAFATHALLHTPPQVSGSTPIPSLDNLRARSALGNLRVTVKWGRTVNLENYENCRPELLLSADVADDEDPIEAIRSLFATCYEEVEAQVAYELEVRRMRGWIGDYRRTFVELAQALYDIEAMTWLRPPDTLHLLEAITTNVENWIGHFARRLPELCHALTELPTLPLSNTTIAALTAKTNEAINTALQKAQKARQEQLAQRQRYVTHLQEAIDAAREFVAQGGQDYSYEEAEAQGFDPYVLSKKREKQGQNPVYGWAIIYSGLRVQHDAIEIQRVVRATRPSLLATSQPEAYLHPLPEPASDADELPF